MSQALILLLLAAASVWAEPSACTDVYSDQILGIDMARAEPVLRLIPAGTRIAPAPTPGGTRVFSPQELQSLAARFGLDPHVLKQEICFRVPLAPLNREDVLAAMRSSLSSPEAHIELAEVSPEPAPPGTIVFPLEGLVRPASSGSAALWRGEMVSGSRHVTIWARAKVSAPVTRLMAVDDLKPGSVIQSQQVRSETIDGFPVATKTGPLTPERVAGLTSLRLIPAGSEIRSDNLVRPLDVLRGDLVQVHVVLGKARLSLNGRAESAGRVGEMIAVRNTESNRVFQARVESKGAVLVDPRGAGAE